MYVYMYITVRELFCRHIFCITTQSQNWRKLKLYLYILVKISHCKMYMYSGILLNRHPSTVDTCVITDISECPDRISIDLHSKPLNSGHPAIPYDGH